MNSRKFVWLFCLALTGCGAEDTPLKRDDFGARVVIRYILEAEARCASAGIHSIAECAEMPTSNEGERMAALTAQVAYETFQSACHPDLGMSKCEELVDQAYREAKTR